MDDQGQPVQAIISRRSLGRAVPLLGGAAIGAVVAADPAEAATFSRRFFAAALQHELLLRPIGRTVYLMPPYVLDDDEIDGLAARRRGQGRCTAAIAEQVIEKIRQFFRRVGGVRGQTERPRSRERNQW